MARRVIAGAVRRWSDDHPEALEKVLLVGFDAATAADFTAALA